MDLTRNQFLRLLAGTGAGALGLSALGACDGSDAKTPDAPPGNPDAPKVDAALDAPTTAGNCLQNGTTVSFDLHFHMLTMGITKADIMAGSEKTYTMDGSGHTHTVVVTAEMFTKLQQNMQVTVKSSTDEGHPHNVTIKCA